MKPKKFDKLKVGDRVQLAVPLKEYGRGYKTRDGCVYVPTGTWGTVSAVQVPFVTNQERNFHCIDFAHDTKLVNREGMPFKYKNEHKNRYRVAAIESELV